VLLPRGIRSLGRVYLTTENTVVSTNFVVLSLESELEAKLIVTWISSIFYQLICEVNGKQQEGMRKMEVADIESTFMPIIACLSAFEIESLVTTFDDIEFLNLNRPDIRNVDILWAEILFGSDSQNRLEDAKRLLRFLTNTRNPM